MDDLISRQVAINALMPIYKSASLRNRNVFSTARKCMVTIEELPSAQQWTPCSEGLPKTDDVYLVTIHPDYVPQECKQVDRMYYFKGEWLWLNEKAEWEKWPDPIIAWMPLPEPYKVERKEE